MHPIWRFILTAVAAAAIALAILATPVLFRGGETAEPRRTPEPGLRATPGEIRTMPDVSATTRGELTAEIGSALVRLYERAFGDPDRPPEPEASPGPKPSVRLRPLLTKIARAALTKSPAVFDDASDLFVYSGTVTFEGVVTFDGKQPLEALVEVDFGGEAVPAARSPVLKVRQRGTMVLKRTGGDWLLDGFDLRFATRPLPSPTPR